MKKSLKVIYSLLGLFCIVNCGNCNNFATPDRFGGDGDLDYQTYVNDFRKNSKDFENFVKYYGKPCVMKQVFPNSSNELFGPFSLTILKLGDKYKSALFSKKDSELSEDEKKRKNELIEEHKKRQKLESLVKKINETTDPDQKKYLESKALELLRDPNLQEKEKSFFILQGIIKEPVILNGVQIVRFSSETKSSGDDQNLIFNTTWTITADHPGSIKIHRYFLHNITDENRINKDDHYLTLEFNKHNNLTQRINFSQNVAFPEDYISKDVELNIIPQCFGTCNDFHYSVNLSGTPKYHLTHRFPYLRDEGGKKYVYRRHSRNFMATDLACCFGISKDDYLKNIQIKFNYSSSQPIGHMEGAMIIYNGPYSCTPCKIGSDSSDSIVYDSTNLPDEKNGVRRRLYDTFDHEFFIKGVKTDNITISFDNLEMIRDIKDRYYTGLEEPHINFSKTSNDILRIYAQRILKEVFHIGKDACTCTKVAALSQFVHHWMTYRQHDRTHLMNPVEIFTFRQGICVDYTHLLIGLCSSLGIKNMAKVSGVGCNSFIEKEKHSWCVCYCPKCNHTFEFDPTWNQCYQVGPEHIYLSKTHRINDTADKMANGDLHRNIDIVIGNHSMNLLDEVL